MLKSPRWVCHFRSSIHAQKNLTNNFKEERLQESGPVNLLLLIYGQHYDVLMHGSTTTLCIFILVILYLY